MAPRPFGLGHGAEESDPGGTAAEAAAAVRPRPSGRDACVAQRREVGTQETAAEEVLPPPVPASQHSRRWPSARPLSERRRAASSATSRACEERIASRKVTCNGERRGWSTASEPVSGSRPWNASNASASRAWSRSSEAAKRRKGRAAPPSSATARPSARSALRTKAPEALLLEPHQLPVPPRVVDPRPRLRDRPARHRVEGPRLGRRREVDVEDDRDEQRRERRRCGGGSPRACSPAREREQEPEDDARGQEAEGAERTR